MSIRRVEPGEAIEMAEHAPEATCEVCTGTFIPRGFYKGWDGSSWCDKCSEGGGWHKVCAGCVEDFGLLGEAMMGDADWTWGTGTPLRVCPDSDEVRVARVLTEPERKADEAPSEYDQLKAQYDRMKARVARTGSL